MWPSARTESKYVALPHGDVIIRIAPDGTQTVVAGNGTEGFSGDGGLATEAELGDPTGVAVAPDGSLYIAEEANNRIRKVSPTGLISTVAGNGTLGVSGNGIPAIQASVERPERIAVGVDSSFYFVDGGDSEIRRVTPDGIIRTVAGTPSVTGFAGDEGAATAARLNCADVAVGPDGGFYLADFGNHRVRRVGPDGIIKTVADYSAEGGMPSSVSLAPDGSVLVAVSFNGAGTPRIDLLKPDGTRATVAGGGNSPVQEGMPATQASLLAVVSVTVAPDGSFYIAQGNSDSRIFQVGPALPGFDGTESLIASEDAGEIYIFDASGRHLRTLNALTGSTLFEFGYDANGVLNQVIEKTGGTDNITTIEHDAAGNPTAIVSPFGQRTTLSVDAGGFLSEISDPAGEAVRMTSDEGGLLKSFANPRGKTNTFLFDAKGHLVADTEPTGASQTLTRAVGANGFTVTRTTSLGHSTTHEIVNSPGNIRQRTVTEPDGRQSQTTEKVDASTTHISTSAGVASDVTLGPDPRFGIESPVATKRVLSYPSGLQTTVTRTRSAGLATPADPLSLKSLTEATTLDGHTSTVTYTALDRSSVATSPLGRSVTSILDNLGRISQISIPGIETTTFSYDSRGRLGAVADGVGASARTNRFTFNSQGFLESMTDPLGRTVQYTHDPVGRITRKLLPDGRQIAYGYDAAGDLTSVTPPGRSQYTLAYDDRGQLTSVTPPAVPGGGPTTYTRDADGFLTGVSRPGGQTIAMAYDTGGRLASRTLFTGAATNSVSTFSYDPATGNLSAISGPAGITLSYVHDGTLLASETWSGPITGVVSRAYDTGLRLATESVSGAPAVNFVYDADGLLTAAGDLVIARDLSNGFPTNATLGITSDSRSHDSAGHLAAYAATAGAIPLYAVNYTRDAIGRITQKVETVGGTTTTVVYTYDLTGRLTDVTTDGAATEHYEYDSNGNRTNAVVRGNAVAGICDAQDRLIQYGATTCSYNAAGDLVGKTNGAQTTVYRYDEAGNLLGATLPDGTTVEYLVDGLNRRVGKRVNGTPVSGFLYGDELNPVAELDGAGVVVSRFVYAGRVTPAYFIKGGVTHRIITDQVGSVRLVVNTATGDVEERLDYDAFGNVLADTNPGLQPFGYAGGLYDSDTGLAHFGARDYDAGSGRWTRTDPLWFAGIDANLYRYAQSDPVNSIDPTGFGILPDVIDDALQDPLDFYGGVFEGALDMAIVGGATITYGGLGLVASMYYLDNHPVLATLESVSESDLIDTQSRVFNFGRTIGPAAICPFAEAGAAAEGSAGALEEETTQIVRARQIPVRPVARSPLKVFTARQAEEGIAEARNAANQAADEALRQSGKEAADQLVSNGIESSGQKTPHDYNPWGGGAPKK